MKESQKTLATSAWSVESVLKKHSAFVGFPVTLNGKRTNAIEALWTKNENEVSDEDATAFYRFVGGGGSAESAPAFRLHFAADAPLTVRSLLFAPSENPERGFGGAGGASDGGGVALYSRRVLIQQNARNVLPAFLRFVRGVIDCEDVPLNVSRETPQDSALVRRLGEIVARRVIKWLADKAKREPEKYAAWYAKLGVFLKEGVCGDEGYLYKDSLVPLLRESSATGLKEGALTSFDAYVERMPESQKEVYYLVAPGGRKQAEASPYLEAMRARGYEVLFLYAHVDEFVMHTAAAQGEGPGLRGGGDVRGYVERYVEYQRGGYRRGGFDHALPRADGVSVRLVRTRRSPAESRASPRARGSPPRRRCLLATSRRRCGGTGPCSR